MTKPTASQLWQRLLDEAGEDAIQSVLKLSDAEVEAELASYGFDVAEERAKGDAMLEQLLQGPSGAEPPPPVRKK